MKKKTTRTHRRSQTKTTSSSLRTKPRAHSMNSGVPSKLKLKSILVPIDFSDISKQALEYAVLFGQQFRAKIHLLHVIEPYLYPVEPEFARLVVDNEGLIRATQQKLDKLAQKAMTPSLLGNAMVRTGRAYKVIVDTAKKMNVDLIVITTHGYTGFERVFLGSTAERVVRYAPCPILAVRRKA